jgi:nicotinamidase-related amidase
MKLDRVRSALVLVDYQVRLMPAIADGEDVLRGGERLARVAHALGVPVIGTEQNPAGLGPSDARIRAVCADTLFKQHFDATRDGLADHLRGLGRDQVVIAGCEAHVCLMQTALGAMAAGFAVMVAADACGSRRPADKALAMQRLERAGAALASTEMIAFEWLGSSDDARFRDVLALVKARPAG